MKGALIAVQFLTRLPTPRLTVTDADFAAAMRWFPVAGLVVGAVAAGAGWLGGRVDGWVGALAALVGWVAITGALHLDGLGDMADAGGAVHKLHGASPEERRARLVAIMADPHVGSFGVVAVGLQLVAKLVLLHALAERQLWAALPAVALAARIGPLVWARWLAPLHAGLASRFAAAVGVGHVAAWGAVGLGLAWWWPGLLAAPVLIGGWWWWLRYRLGGISGDGHGAGIELVESGLMLAVLIAHRL